MSAKKDNKHTADHPESTNALYEGIQKCCGGTPCCRDTTRSSHGSTSSCHEKFWKTHEGTLVAAAYHGHLAEAHHAVVTYHAHLRESPLVAAIHRSHLAEAPFSALTYHGHLTEAPPCCDTSWPSHRSTPYCRD